MLVWRGEFRCHEVLDEILMHEPCMTRHRRFSISVIVQVLVLLLHSNHNIALVSVSEWTTTPDAKPQVDYQGKNVPWYGLTLKMLGLSGKKLLKNYSKITTAEVEHHVYKVVNLVLHLIAGSWTQEGTWPAIMRGAREVQIYFAKNAKSKFGVNMTPRMTVSPLEGSAQERILLLYWFELLCLGI
jgi:hypothetical protein